MAKSKFQRSMSVYNKASDIFSVFHMDKLSLKMLETRLEKATKQEASEDAEDKAAAVRTLADTYEKLSAYYDSYEDDWELHCFHLKKSIEYYEKIDDLTVDDKRNLEFIYRYYSAFISDSIEYANKALDLCSEISEETKTPEDHEALMDAYSFLSEAYSCEHDYDAAREALTTKLTMEQELLAADGDAFAAIRVINTYMAFAALEADACDTAKAMEWFGKAQALAEERLAQKRSTGMTFLLSKVLFEKADLLYATDQAAAVDLAINAAEIRESLIDLEPTLYNDTDYVASMSEACNRIVEMCEETGITGKPDYWKKMGKVYDHWKTLTENN